MRAPDWLTGPDSAAAMDRAAAWLQAWDAQGDHRTGTLGDAAGAAWLAREAAALGASPQSEPVLLDRLDPVAAWLEIDGQRIDGVPVFDAPATDAAGVTGRLVEAAGVTGRLIDAAGVTGRLAEPGDAGDIAVAELTPQAVYSGEYRRLRQAGRHGALAIVTKGASPGLALLNAEQFGEPYSAPAIQLAGESAEPIRAALARGGVARLVAFSRRTRTEARNVVLTLPGRDRSRPPVVVMTPRSSWWHSTAERGGGLVCWLESLRALLAQPPACDVVFTANTGHELGHLGLDDFLVRRPGWDAGGAVWVHYGANLGAAGGALSLLSNDEAPRHTAQSWLAAAGRPPDTVAAPGMVPSGETRDIHRAGGRYLTLVGSNRWFHMPQDRWPHAVDVAAVARVAAAGARIVQTLAG